jgi:allophanate hydrolase subunit 2
VIAGPHDDWFPRTALDLLTASVFTIDPQSDRMGFRLAGGSALPREPGEMISDATVAGGLQVPASGHPILLMADRQTTGGYPIIAVVITADLPAAGQLLPGDQVRFRICSQADARAALMTDPRWRA